MDIATILGLYLLAGIPILILYDLITKRVRRGFRDAAYDTQSKVSVGTKTSIMLTVIALWLFWPAPIGATVYDWFRGLRKQ